MYEYLVKNNAKLFQFVLPSLRNCATFFIRVIKLEYDVLGNILYRVLNGNFIFGLLIFNMSFNAEVKLCG